MCVNEALLLKASILEGVSGGLFCHMSSEILVAIRGFAICKNTELLNKKDLFSVKT